MQSREEYCLWQGQTRFTLIVLKTFQVFDNSSRHIVQWLGKTFNESSLLYLPTI